MAKQEKVNKNYQYAPNKVKLHDFKEDLKVLLYR